MRVSASHSQVSKVGCPIRRSMDQSLFAAPHGLSQRITSFFACACQGIHQMPLRHLIVLIANAHLPSGPKPRRAATFYNGAPQRSHRHVNFDDLSIADNAFTSPREHAERSQEGHQTSFSRSCPMTRGQATSTTRAVRAAQAATTPASRVASFLPSPIPHHIPAG